jgi:allophanate hydrolase
MTHLMRVKSIGGGNTIQDLGRYGWHGMGISQSGVLDTWAVHESAALLGQKPTCAVLEMAGMGGEFEFTQDTRVALTGAKMRATLEGAALEWNATHVIPAGTVLNIGPVLGGQFGYLGVEGGFETEPVLGSRATHVGALLGRPVEAGDVLPIGKARGRGEDLRLAQADRFKGGLIHLVPSLQTTLFHQDQLQRFQDTVFRKDPRANRMGMRLDYDGDPFGIENQRTILSEVILPGDIQMTGDGAPYVLMSECQTTGGYPRIGTVIPSDMARVAQAPIGAEIRCKFITREEGVALEQQAEAQRRALASKVERKLRDPHEMNDLLSYQLIGGAISALDQEGDER